MSIVSQTHPFVVGVDTHAKKHVYAILTAAGELIETRDFPTSDTGIKRALAWVGRRTGGDASTLWVIEGAASYGAILAGTVADAGYPVAEAARMDAKARHGVGKSDPMDAYRIASTVLPTDTNVTPPPAQRGRPGRATGAGDRTGRDDHRADPARQRAHRPAPGEPAGY